MSIHKQLTSYKFEHKQVWQYKYTISLIPILNKNTGIQYTNTLKLNSNGKFNTNLNNNNNDNKFDTNTWILIPSLIL